MLLLAALPMPVALAATFVAGVLAGALVNWSVYALAWNPRSISPWSPSDPKAPARQISDCMPILGWLGLRREESLHGKNFWVRPMFVELFMGCAWAALYWWEVVRQGLVAEQFAAIAGGPLVPGAIVAPEWTTYATFLSHVLLISLMAAASLVDIDEKSIPKEITDYGTLLAWVLATLLPMSLLPHAALLNAVPTAGVEIALPSGALDNGVLALEPVTPLAPNEWPALFDGAPNWISLVVALVCLKIWAFAISLRVWRGSRGVVYGMKILLTRVIREWTLMPWPLIAVAATGWIVATWWHGGAAWVGLLSSLIGTVGGGAMVWAVRKAGTWALGKEALGFGDVTLMMMVGAFLGWQAGVVIFFLSPFAAMIVGLLQLILRRDDEIFFGPFLCMAAVALIVRWATFWNADAPLQAVFSMPWLVIGILAAGVAVLWAMLVLWRNIKEAMFAAPQD